MIGILDQIEVNAVNLTALQTLVAESYLPAAQARGMTLARSWISPPVTTFAAPNTLWILWELADIGAWWNMRARAGADPATVSYWAQEYARLDDLLGEYMVHPMHWAYIDPWFDPEFSRQIISTQLSHAFCNATDSVLAWNC